MTELDEPQDKPHALHEPDDGFDDSCNYGYESRYE